MHDIVSTEENDVIIVKFDSHGHHVKDRVQDLKQKITRLFPNNKVMFVEEKIGIEFKKLISEHNNLTTEQFVLVSVPVEFPEESKKRLCMSVRKQVEQNLGIPVVFVAKNCDFKTMNDNDFVSILKQLPNDRRERILRRLYDA